MTELVSLVAAWPAEMQLSLLLTLGIAGVVAAAVCVGMACANARLLLRGYPPGRPHPCRDGTNLTGVCVKAGGCMSLPECHRALEAARRGREQAAADVCNHDDNLTGKCLKPGGCRTDGECRRAVMGWDGPAAQGDVPDVRGGA